MLPIPYSTLKLQANTHLDVMLLI